MSDKNYVVPKAGLEAAIEAAGSTLKDTDWKQVVAVAVHAFIRWQAENPIIPTHEQAIHLCEIFEDESGSRRPDYCDSVRAVAIEWQRRMYLAPEPEAPQVASEVLFARTRLRGIADGLCKILPLNISITVERKAG
jgi:hypothetical protein